MPQLLPCRPLEDRKETLAARCVQPLTFRVVEKIVNVAGNLNTGEFLADVGV
jgi:hypothetical protein